MDDNKPFQIPRNDVQAFSSQPTVGRRTNPDGTVTIRCRICGKPLMRAANVNFSSATCSDCYGMPTDDVQTGAITLTDGRIVYGPQVFTDAVLYNEKPELEKVGLARAVFRALGFGRKKEPKQPAKESKATAKEKQRKPLFDSGESE